MAAGDEKFGIIARARAHSMWNAKSWATFAKTRSKATPTSANGFTGRGSIYKTPKEVAHLFTDIVSKNGSLMLSIPLLPDGTLDSREESILNDFTAWDSRTGDLRFALWGCLRFTAQSSDLYCFCLGWPAGDVRIKSLGRSAPGGQRKIDTIRVVGSDETLGWTQEDDALRVAHPKSNPSDITLCLEIK